MSKDTKVKCDVNSCKHNNCNCCDLDVLDITCTCDGEDCENKSETICGSFATKDEE